MADADTPTESKPGLPMVLEPARPRPSLARSPNKAAFVSQLIAARQNSAEVKAPMPVNSSALGAYSEGAKATARRMPQGYRKTMIV